MFYSTSVVYVPTSTSIAACIRLMRRVKVGSLLILSADLEQKLVGIFTERDILRLAPQLQRGNHWNKPIGLVMTRPVRTLELGKIEQAASIMLQYGIRHIPIVMGQGGFRSDIVGVVSMRDLFKKFVFESENRHKAPLLSSSIKVNLGPRRAAYLSQDPNLLQLFHKLDHELSLTEIKSVSDLLPKPKTPKAPFNLIILDLEGMKPTEWSPLFTKISQEIKPKNFLIFYNPVAQGARATEYLEKLSLTTKYRIFAKPINILALSDYLNQID